MLMVNLLFNAHQVFIFFFNHYFSETRTNYLKLLTFGILKLDGKYLISDIYLRKITKARLYVEGI